MGIGSEDSSFSEGILGPISSSPTLKEEIDMGVHSVSFDSANQHHIINSTPDSAEDKVVMIAGLQTELSETVDSLNFIMMHPNANPILFQAQFRRKRSLEAQILRLQGQIPSEAPLGQSRTHQNPPPASLPVVRSASNNNADRSRKRSADVSATTEFAVAKKKEEKRNSQSKAGKKQAKKRTQAGMIHARRTSPRKKTQDVPVETVEFNGKEANASDTSSFGAFGAEHLAGEQDDDDEEKGIPSTPVADGLTNWAGMWNSMQEQGWDWMPGEGLVDWYYVHPSFAQRSKSEVLKEGKVGQDYFVNEDSMMRYAKQYLGFRGKVKTPESNNKNGGQRRGRKRSAAVATTAEPIVETKKEKKRNSKAEKKQANETKGKRESIILTYSNESENADDSSCFSDFNFVPKSPTSLWSEAEESARKNLTYSYSAKQHNSTLETAQESVDSGSDNTEMDYASNGAETESEVSEASSEDNTFQVMSSGDAWKLLMENFGFKYHKGMYCLPGDENKPGKDSCAIEGRHYFSTLMELRKHLCAYGIPKCKRFLAYPDVMAISRWVRFANVKGLPDAAIVNPADVGGYLSFRGAWSMLQKLGLTWSGGFYIVEDPDILKESKQFENQEDLSVHLARFGIPHIRGSANVGLTDDDRLRLDLYIASAKIDSFKRIDPDKENVNEITPRRSRSKHSSDAAESSKDVENLLQLSPTEPKQVLGHREYQMTFNNLETQRQMDLSQIDSEKSYKLLAENYNFCESTSYDPAHYGSKYFCFPNAAPTEKFKLGVDFFESLQDMREYLCAYGLPSRAKHTKISYDDMAELEQWIRSAHIKEPYDEYATASDRMKPKEVKNILKGLGYQFSKHFEFYLLPDTSCHKSQVGRDRFEELIDLFNHIARFGLSSSGEGGVFSIAELQRVQLFIASIATNDLTQHIECRDPLPKRNPIALMKTPHVATKQSEPDHNASEVEVKTPKQVPVVLDQEDTPEPQQQTPRKPKGILNYFAKTVAGGVSSVVKADLTPSKQNSVQSEIDVNASLQRYSSNEAAESNSISSTGEDASPPSVEETAVDEEVETGFQDPAHFDKEKVEYSLSESQIHLPWAELWKEMRSEGWRYAAGNSTVSYYYIHSRWAGVKKKEVLLGKKGSDYFESEDEVRIFAKEHLGWKGEKLLSTPGEMMMSSHVATNERNERNPKQAPVVLMKPPPASAKQHKYIYMTTIQQQGASEIDTNIAPLQFGKRLCLVKTLCNTDFAFTPGRAGPDQTVSVNKLWPALKFNTYNELKDQLKMDNKRKARFAVAATKLARKAGVSMGKAGFAYLLGKGDQSANFLAILKKNDSGELIEDGVIFDFFDSMIEMEGAEGYCASFEFQHAFKIAMARMEMEESVEEFMPVQVTTVNLAKKTLAMDEQPTQDEEARKETPTRKMKQDVPVETVEFTGKEANASDTSSFGEFGAELAGEQDDDDDDEGKGIPSTPVADGLTNWAGMWNSMQDQGWVWMPGEGLVDWYYVHPSFAHRSKSEVLKKGKLGEDYFVNAESIMRYAKEHLGWKGEQLLSAQGELMMSSPVISTATTNKRKERNASDWNASLSKKSRTDCQHSDVQKPTNSSTLGNKGQISKSSHTGESKESYIPLPDQKLTYKDKLEYCKLTLHPSYKPKTGRLSSTSNSVVGQLENEIKLFMTRAIGTGYKIDGMAGQSPGFMYICGGPGTGKTTAVTACSQHLAKWAKDREIVKPCYCHINMASYSYASMSIDAIKKQMLKSMAKKLEIDKNSSQAVFVKQFRRKGMMLVVDEIDMLIKNQGGSGEQWFSTLIEWCEDKELPFSMIGISNSVNDSNATKIRDLSNTPHELVFPTYNEEDLLAILEQRIGKKIVDTKALQLIVKRVAASTGDARKALEITSNAVDKALDACAVKWLEEVEADSYPLVKLPQMMRAIREGMPTRHSENIRGLPRAAKVILCIAVSLGKVWGPTAAVSILTLKKYAVQATHHAMLDDASLGMITNLVEMLIDSGLLTTTLDGCFNFNANDHSSRLCIAVQLDDVEIALEKSLLEESSFYRSLVDYVKRECPRPEYQ